MEMPAAVDAPLRKRGLTSAAWGVARAVILALNLGTLALARFGVPVYVLLCVVAISLLVLYAVDSRRAGFRLWAAYVLGFVLFADLRTLADETGIAVKGGYALRAESWLFGGTLPTEWLQHHLYRAPGALEFFAAGVYVSYYVLPHLLALVLWRRHFEAFKRYGLSVLLTVYTGLAICVVAPTAPPWLAERFAGGPPLVRVLTDVFGQSPEGVTGDSGVVGTNPFAAMPSLHMAMTMLVVLALWRRPLVRWLAALYAVSMGFVLVYMGEHYVVDEAAGVLTAVAAWAAASYLLQGRGLRRPTAKPVVIRSGLVEPAGERG